MQGRRWVLSGVILLVVGALIAGVFSGVLPGVVRQGMAATGLIPDSSSTPSRPAAVTSPATPAPTQPPAAPSEQPEPAGMPADVLTPARPVAGTLTAEVSDRVDAVSTKDVRGRISAEVVDVSSGKALYRRGADTALIPASTMKLLTSAAALRLLGPDHRFRTTVVQPSASTVVLVGGGDPYLAAKTDARRYPVRASVADLAARTADALKAQKRVSVRVGYDATLFRGPAWNPTWPSGYSDQVTRTSALWVDEGRLAGGSPGPRSSDPAGDAAKAFATALRKKGITVSTVKPTKAEGAARTIAEVSSMPLERIVEQLLMSSDNDAAETLLRQAGLAAGQSGSIKAGAEAVEAELTELDVWAKGTEVHDGSGLSRSTRVPAATMVELLRLAATGEHPELRALITGLPVAGVEGSLRGRYGADDTEDARGIVRGKTGTLRKVHSLAGFLRTADGSMLAYAFLVNDPPNDYAAVVWLEKVTAALASCGCR